MSGTHEVWQRSWGGRLKGRTVVTWNDGANLEEKWEQQRATGTGKKDRETRRREMDAELELRMASLDGLQRPIHWGRRQRGLDWGKEGLQKEREHMEEWQRRM